LLLLPYSAIVALHMLNLTVIWSCVAMCLQVIKVVFPVYYGSRYQMTKVPQHVFLKGIQVYHEVHSDMQQQQAEEEEHTAAEAAAQQKAANALRLRRSCATEAACACPPLAAMPRQVMA
jgi:hypothetical protein